MTYKGDRNPNYKGRDKILYICYNCGANFLAKRPQHPTKCCSKKCSVEWVGKMGKGKIIYKEATAKQKISHRATLKEKGVIDPQIRRTCKCGNKKDEKAVVCVLCFREKIKFSTECIICGVTFYKRTKTCSSVCNSKRMQQIYSGENNPNWKGGIKSENQRQRNHLSYKEWRMAVYARDNYTCQDCGKTKCYLHAHHIKPFSKYPELRTDVSNGKTLCVPCHSKYHNSLNVKNYKSQSL